MIVVPKEGFPETPVLIPFLCNQYYVYLRSISRIIVLLTLLWRGFIQMRPTLNLCLKLLVFSGDKLVWVLVGKISTHFFRKNVRVISTCFVRLVVLMFLYIKIVTVLSTHTVIGRFILIPKPFSVSICSTKMISLVASHRAIHLASVLVSASLFDVQQTGTSFTPVKLLCDSRSPVQLESQKHTSSQYSLLGLACEMNA